MSLKFDLDPDDLRSLDRRLDLLDRKLRRSIVRKATRRAVAVHIHPQMVRAVKDHTQTSSESTGTLARSVKIRALKRSRKYQGHQSISINNTGTKDYYGGYWNYGRTFNMFLPQPLWDLVPEAAKGKGALLWRRGKKSWNRVARQRGPRAVRSCLRNITKMLDIEVRAGNIKRP